MNTKDLNIHSHNKEIELEELHSAFEAVNSNIVKDTRLGKRLRSGGYVSLPKDAKSKQGTIARSIIKPLTRMFKIA